MLNILKFFRSAPSRQSKSLADALAPLVLIANKFDSNQLTGLALKVGCCGPTTVPPECMVIAADRSGRPLLTVADCLKARAAIGGTLDFGAVPISPSQTEYSSDMRFK